MMGPYIWVNFACGCLSIIIIIKYILSIRRKMKLVLPPSPPGRPLLGHLHLLQRPLHRSLHKLAVAYGPLLYLNMGRVPAVVVSSPHWAQEFLHTHERDFSDRPSLEAGKRLFYNNKTLVLMQHGPLWRELRKLYTVQMLTMKRIDMFEEARQEEMAMAVKVLGDNEGGIMEVEMRKLVFGVVGNMMTRMLFSRRLFGYGKGRCRRCSESKGSLKKGGDGGTASCRCRCRESLGFEEMIEEMAVLFGAPVIGDLIPCLAWLDVGGYKKRMNRLASQLDAFLEEILAARIKNGNNKAPEDFLRLLITLYDHDVHEGKECIKAILLDLLSAGTETTTTAVEWAMAELLRNPHCMSKLQEELATIHPMTTKAKSNEDTLDIGKPIRDEDLPKLPYLQAVIKETLRLHPPIPIVVRQLSKSLTNGKVVGAYNLPQNTRLFVNVWALGRDTNTWGENAASFCPDKFLGPSSLADFRGQHFELLPFGSGRRGCPGMNLGLSMVALVLANLVHFFEWKLPHGYTLDLSEAPSRTAPMAKPLIATPICKT